MCDRPRWWWWWWWWFTRLTRAPTHLPRAASRFVIVRTCTPVPDRRRNIRPYDANKYTIMQRVPTFLGGCETKHHTTACVCVCAKQTQASARLLCAQGAGRRPRKVSFDEAHGFCQKRRTAPAAIRTARAVACPSLQSDIPCATRVHSNIITI